jgi:predicted DNA-binding protein
MGDFRTSVRIHTPTENRGMTGGYMGIKTLFSDQDREMLKVVGVRLDVDIIDEIDELAESSGITRSEYIRAAIFQVLHEGLNPLYIDAESIPYVENMPKGVDSSPWSRQRELWAIYYNTKWGDGE